MVTDFRKKMQSYSTQNVIGLVISVESEFMSHFNLLGLSPIMGHEMREIASCDRLRSTNSYS